MSFFDETSDPPWVKEAARIIRVKHELLQKGQACYWCGRELSPESATLEHITPKSKGGETSVENGALACTSCNKKRGIMSEDEFRSSKYLTRKIAMLEAERQGKKRERVMTQARPCR